MPLRCEISGGWRYCSHPRHALRCGAWRERVKEPMLPCHAARHIQMQGSPLLERGTSEQ